MLFSFSKWTGAGNDFVLFHLQNMPDVPSQQCVEWISNACHRQLGIGADGVIFCGVLDEKSYWMRIFNKDGSCPLMCGNALRCTTAFFNYQRKAHGPQHFSIHLPKSKHEVFVQSDGQPCVEISVPAFAQPVSLKAKEHTFAGLLIDTGVPHFVVRVEDISPKQVELDQIPLELWGPLLRQKSNWADFNCSNGVNVTFVKVIKSDHLRIRTFERGVEAETLACGTGAAAAAWAHGNLRSESSPCNVEFPSRERAIIHMTNHQAKLRLWQTGPARCIFKGHIEISDELNNELIQPA